jgi:hypothetical protein
MSRLASLANRRRNGINRLASDGQTGRRNGTGGPDAWSSEMPRFPRPGGLSRERDEPVLDMILDRVSLPPEAPPEMAALPQMMADLAGPAGPEELAGEAAVLSRFRNRLAPAGVSPAARPPGRRRSSQRLAPHSPRLAAGMVVAVVALGGTAAAYAGALPAPLQDFAHRTIDAPARHVPGHRSGVAPGHRSGVTPAASASRQQSSRAAAPGSTGKHGTPGSGELPAATAPANLRRSAELSPQPARPPVPVKPTSPAEPAPSPGPTRPTHRTHRPEAGTLTRGPGAEPHAPPTMGPQGKPPG